MWLQHLLALGFLPTPWRMPVYAVCGVAAGLGLVLLRVSEMPSYLSDNPRTCMNCHVMAPQYATWERSSHARVAVCNDCHVPHDSLLRKYAFKARDGMRHATIFTLRREPQVIRASAGARPVIQQNCLRCHAQRLRHVSHLTSSGRSCTDCHRTVPHGDVGGLASTPHARVPKLPPVTAWPFSGGQHQ